MVPWRRLQALCLAYGLFFSAVLAGAHALPAFGDQDAISHPIICTTSSAADDAPDRTPIHDHDERESLCCVPALSADLSRPSFDAVRINSLSAPLNSWLRTIHDPIAGYPLSAPGMLRAPPSEV